MATLKQLWINLRYSLWFLPLLLVGGMVALGFLLIQADQQFQRQLSAFGRLLTAEPEGSQAMLAAIATSMITVAGVVFSITIVALAQASAQFSPRILRNFMRDRANQVVLGSFVGIFAYCLVVLRSLSHRQDAASVPSLAVFVGFVFALLGIALLIYFIHHIASCIQASVMVDSITAETLEVVREMFPAHDDGQDSRPAVLPEAVQQKLEDCTWHPVPALRFGYVQVIETSALIKIACRENLVLRMEVAVGEFAYLKKALVSITSCPPPDQKLIRKINRAYGINSHRTVEQDPGFGLRQLVDMAVKALSPGINDTTTAVTAVDHLSQLLCEIATRRLQPSHHYNGQELRIIARGASFQALLNQAFDIIIENAEGNKAVLTHLLSSLERIAGSTDNPARLQALLEQAQAVAEMAAASIKSSRTSEKAKAHAAAAIENIRQKLH